MTCLLKTLDPIFFQLHVTESEATWVYRQVPGDKVTFTIFPSVHYATDVCFQQSYRRIGTQHEVEPWCSGKHKLYGYKIEAGFIPCGISIFVSSNERGSVADIEVIRQNAWTHDRLLLKNPDELDIEDKTPDDEQQRAHWATLNDIGNQRADE